INETLLEMNSVEVAQLINTIRLVERKMGFVYTSFKSSVYSVVNQEQDQEQQNQSQDRIYVADDAQDHQGNQSQTPEHHQQAHRSFQLDNGEEEVSFLDPPQRPQAQTPYQTEQTQQTRDSQTPYQNLMMRSSLFRNSNSNNNSRSRSNSDQNSQHLFFSGYSKETVDLRLEASGPLLHSPVGLDPSGAAMSIRIGRGINKLPAEKKA
ncbi:hypothetical protein BGZ52_007770, partial [Haplosporangium bisporale]